MLTVHAITPFVMVSDLEAGIAFLEGLGFGCTFRGTEPGYAFLRCEGGAVRLLQTDADLTDEKRQQMVYIDVPDVDALWAERRAFIETLPETHRRAPFDQFYGQREFHVIHGPTLFLYGQSVK